MSLSHRDRQTLCDATGAYLAKIAKLYSDGYKLTLVARHPEKPNGYVVVGDDEDLAAVQATIEQSKTPHSTNESGVFTV